MGGYTGALGPVVLSIFINTYVSGVVGFQYALFQALRYKKSLSIRFTVLSIYVIDVFQIVIAFYMIWIYCVTYYIDPRALGNVVLWIFTTIPLYSALSSFIAHAFMTYRISLFTKRRFLLAALAVLSLAVFLLGLAVGSYGIKHRVSMMHIIAGACTYRSLLLVWFVARLILDLVMLVTMASIYHGQGQDFLSHIQLRTVRIGITAIQCGSLTTLFSICILVSFLSSPKTTAYVVFLLPSGRLYSNIILTTVNSMPPRESIRAEVPSIVLTKDLWAGNQTTHASSRQSMSLNRIETEHEAIDGTQSGDAASISSRPSVTFEKKSEGLLPTTSTDDRNFE
ncbi:hypothetical protein BJ912DRAFT_362532 [Pholiota molesta]|nr:hypothetical protein BJ912DRAFT_362532 [Pholiota molesta]